MTANMKKKDRPNTNSTGNSVFFLLPLALRPGSRRQMPTGPVIPALPPASENETKTRQSSKGGNLVVLGTTSALGGADLEAVVEAAVDLLEVTHSAGAGGLSALGLLAPVDCIKRTS